MLFALHPAVSMASNHLGLSSLAAQDEAPFTFNGSATSYLLLYCYYGFWFQKVAFAHSMRRRRGVSRSTISMLSE